VLEKVFKTGLNDHLTLEALGVPVLVEDLQPLSRSLAFLRGDRLLASAAPWSKFPLKKIKKYIFFFYFFH